MPWHAHVINSSIHLIPKRKAWWWSRMVATATNGNIIYSLLSILHTLVMSWLFSFIYVFFVQSIHSMQSNLPTPSSKVIYKGKIDEKSSSLLTPTTSTPLCSHVLSFL